MSLPNPSSQELLRTSIPTVKILGSSSSGNCGLIVTRDSRILVDAGFSGKRICQLLENAGLQIRDIDAVFLTHEHADHARGIRGLCKYEHLTWVSNRATYEALPHPGKAAMRWSLFETGSRFRFRDLEVEAFSIPHDAADPVGFLFHCGEDDLFNPRRNIAWILDVGYITALMRDKISRAHVLVIESNYDKALLEEDLKRPWSVKQRILSRHGHLSNDATLALIREFEGGRLNEIHLAHISKDCNSAQAIRRTFAQVLEANTNGLCIHFFDPDQGRSCLLAEENS